MSTIPYLTIMGYEYLDIPTEYRSNILNEYVLMCETGRFTYVLFKNKQMRYRIYVFEACIEDVVAGRVDFSHTKQRCGIYASSQYRLYHREYLLFLSKFDRSIGC